MADTKADTAKATEMGGNAKMWIGGLVVVVIILAVANWYYMKQIKAAKDAAAATPKSSGMMGPDVTAKTDNTTINTSNATKEVFDPTNVATT